MEESPHMWSNVSQWVNYATYSSSVRQNGVEQAVKIMIHPSLRLKVWGRKCRGLCCLLWSQSVDTLTWFYLIMYLGWVLQSQVWLKTWCHHSCQTHRPTGFCGTVDGGGKNKTAKANTSIHLNCSIHTARSDASLFTRFSWHLSFCMMSITRRSWKQHYESGEDQFR